MKKKSKVELEYLDGIHVAGSILWLDAPRLADLCFLSHALLKPGGPLRKLIVSENTWQLMGKPQGAKVLAVPYFHRFTVGTLTLQLVPSGYLPGAAQLIIDREGKRMVYSGDFCLLECITTERAQPQPADALILRTHLPPHLAFPDRQKVQEQILHWVRDNERKGRTALFLVDETAAALELTALLRSFDFSAHLHREFFSLAWRAMALGIPLKGAHRHRSESEKPAVLVWPWKLRKSTALQRLQSVDIMVLSATAALPDATKQLEAENVACFSQLPDRRQVETYLELSKPNKIYLTGKSAEKWNAFLLERGLRSVLLAPPQQLGLFDRMETEGDN